MYKHTYKEVAEALKAARPNLNFEGDGSQLAAIRIGRAMQFTMVLEKIIEMFKKDNSRFVEQKFRKTISE